MAKPKGSKNKINKKIKRNCLICGKENKIACELIRDNLEIIDDILNRFTKPQSNKII